jgi:putative peptidoglycan lipid II flippase
MNGKPQPAEDRGCSLGTPAQEGRRVARAVGTMGILTVASRILGLARDVAQAAVLGTGMAADCFTLAFIIPNILRRLFGESTVSAAFVPTYTGTLMTDDRSRSSKLGSAVLTVSGLLLAGCIIAGLLGAPLLVRLFGPGFAAVPGKLQLATGLLRLLFPYIFFVGTAALVMGILNSSRHFFAPALSPVLFNMAALLGLLAVARIWKPDAPVWGYSAGILAGGVLQLLVQLPALRKSGFRYTPTLGRGDSGLADVAKLALPALLGLMVAEVNVMVDQVVASVLEPGSVSALAYGNRIMQFPLGVFAVALATALLPTLSRQTALGRLREARVTLGYATLGLALLMIPATLFIVVMGRPMVLAILDRGAFTTESVTLTTAALVYYSLGLLFYGVVKVTAPVFYALRDTRTPVRIAMVCMGFNIVFNILFAWVFSVTGLQKPLAGVALASSLSSVLNVILLRSALRRILGPGEGAPGAAWLAMLPASFVSLAVLLVLRRWVDTLVGSSLAGGVLALLAAGLAAYAACAAVFLAAGGRSAKALWRLVLRRDGHDA